MADPLFLEQIAETVRSAAKLGPDVVITESSSLLDDLGIDSLDLAGMVLKLQDRFDVMIDDEELANLRTIADVAEAIRSKQEAVPAGS